MNAQLSGAFVLFFTSAARVAPLVGVHQLVGLEMGVLSESLLANLALVRLLSRVHHAVVMQSG